MDILSQLNSPAMYLICGGIIFFVALAVSYTHLTLPTNSRV